MNRGLTLIECIITTAILSILITLTLTGIQKTHSASIKTIIIQDLKTLATLSNKWAIDHGRYPMALSWENENLNAWDYTQSSENSWAPSKLWEYGANKPILRPNIKKINLIGQTGYNYNTSYVGGESPYGESVENPATRPSLRLAHAKRSASAACFGISSISGGEYNRWMRSPTRINRQGEFAPESFQTVYAGTQSFCLNLNTFASHLDGHVGIFKDPQKGIHIQTLPVWITNALQYPLNGFLSNDDKAYRPW